MQLLSALLISLSLVSSPKIDKNAFYKAFESSDEIELKSHIHFLSRFPESNQKSAYTGALRMKASQFLKTPKEKTTQFNQGKKELETALSSSPKNVEYHFLRLVIQENSPKILKYNGNLDSDSKLIISQFSSLEPVVKIAIKKYARISNVLTSSQLE